MNTIAVIYTTHVGRVRSFLRQSGFAADDVADLTQRVFVTAYLSLQNLREPTRIASWLIGIARRVASDERRKLSRRRKMLDDAGYLGVLEPTFRDPELQLQEAEQSLILRRSLSGLRARPRLVLAKLLAGHRPQEIATSSGMSVAAVYSCLRRAQLDALRGGRRRARLPLRAVNA